MIDNPMFYRRSFLSLFVLLALTSSPVLATGEIHLRIIQPYEGTSFPFVEQSFVMGSVLPVTATLTLNGVPVHPHKNGGFLEIIPFSEGAFTITAVAFDGVSTATVSRRVFVQPRQEAFDERSREIRPMAPTVELVVRPNDTLDVAFQGAPGGQAHFRVSGESGHFPMHEQPGRVGGIYRGVYRIQPEDRFSGSELTYYLRRADGDRLNRKAPGRITVQRRRMPRLVELTDDAVLLTGPNTSLGYHLFLARGVTLEVTGESGDFLRVTLGRFNEGWIRKSLARELEAGARMPTSVTRNIRVDAFGSSTTVHIPLQHRHAHRVEQTIDPHRLQLTLFGVTADSDRVRYRSKDAVVREVLWQQYEPETATFDILTRLPHPWGYDVRYVDTGMVLEIRHRPPEAPMRGAPLRGIKVALDAGHSNESWGTIGPWGNTEATVNLLTANVAKREFERLGAEVVMIQDGTRNPSLAERVSMAWESRAHLFISLHADACGPQQDPREVEGFSVHYYHPHSRLFAEILHDLYGRRMGIRDQGLWRSNLAVCRMPQMPAVLLETAFLILPEYEDLLLQPRFQQAVAETLVQAVRTFLERTR